MNKCQLGNVGEVLVMLEAIKRGYGVSVPQSASSRYDLIIDKDGQLYKVQVKAVESDGITVKVPGKSVTRIAGKFVDNFYSAADIDCVVVFDQTTNRTAWVPIAEFGDQKGVVTLRYVPSVNNQAKGVRWFVDYEVW